ncbi:lipase family protein [Rahnella perminowiae]|uniref:lipase family protein n=1 Tax=Rahnella perminowiae TaxID=2816244 RepID=UPI0036686CE6
MATQQAYTSASPKNHDAYTGKQKPYWVEIQLVDEEGKAVANMPWQAENSATPGGYEKELNGTSDATGLIRIEPRYGSELRLFIDAQPLVKEMEQRSLRVSREPNDSTVRNDAEENGHIWHYAVIGELCRTVPDIERRDGEPFPPPFHFPADKSLKGFKIRTNELEQRHVIEICPFRAWELVLHHQKDYSMANAINLGAAASLAYADDSMFDTASISRFFLTQCQDLFKLPQLRKGTYITNTLAHDVPFSERYHPPVFMDTSRDTSGSYGENGEEKPSIAGNGDTQLFYAYNNDKMIISWRGTAGLYDVGTDLVFRPVNTETCEINKVQCATLFPKGKVHEGFWNGYSRIGAKFKEKFEILNDLSERLDLFICGHSLGGALALINSAFLKDYNPVFYSYGMPRTFTRDSIALLSDLIHFRHVNDNDPVPAVPPEANVDNYLYELWGPVGGVLGGLWSSLIELPAWQIKQWGDCFWHHGNPVVFLTTTQSREWKDCNRTYPVAAGCITLKSRMPVKTKLYLVPALAEKVAQEAGQDQKGFINSLTQEDLAKYFPEGKNPNRGADLTFGDHFMTAYMPYINNKLLELIDDKGLSKDKHFTEHKENVKKFVEQMSEESFEIPKNESERNINFLTLETMLEKTLLSTLKIKNGKDSLERFAHYGEEEIENA